MAANLLNVVKFLQQYQFNFDIIIFKLTIEPNINLHEISKATSEKHKEIGSE